TPGTAWMYLVRDLVAAASLGAGRRRATGGYARSLASVRAWAAFAGDDPVPGLLDMPLTAWRGPGAASRGARRRGGRGRPPRSGGG
ncbi:MAG TPA: hypothetical protein PKD01_10355, partial [Mesorhizobium sp.]|nr:hypothetical protein [Mesorhizobium sp.]